ncbi:MAG: hypothetical protein AAFY59_00130 [Pseudomonadota bacterium]
MIRTITALALVVGLPANADTSLEALKSRVVGHWQSIACEIRPQSNPEDPALAPIPTYLTRDFTYDAEDGFAATITVFADAACTIPAITYDFAGEIQWLGPNPAAPGAHSQNYVLNRALTLTVLAAPMAAQLNQLPEGACGMGSFEVGKARDILGQPCALLKFVEGSAYVIDHDFLYVREDTPNMLFMGAKHVDGTGFYTPENRPQTGLQQPLIRVN